jgi:small subunit ribosomal protein S9
MTQEETSPATSTEPSGQYHYGTGRRKEAIARVRLYPGSGTIEINGRPFLDVFTRVVHQNKVRLPLEVANATSNFNIQARIAGGGITAWADALAHGTARALVEFDENLRSPLRKAGLLTRDPRVKERKKYGLKRARKAPQYTKR